MYPHEERMKAVKELSHKAKGLETIFGKEEAIEKIEQFIQEEESLLEHYFPHTPLNPESVPPTRPKRILEIAHKLLLAVRAPTPPELALSEEDSKKASALLPFDTSKLSKESKKFISSLIFFSLDGNAPTPSSSSHEPSSKGPA